jgi:hypothetical protein
MWTLTLSILFSEIRCMSEQISCPSCGTTVTTLRALGSALIKKLAEEGHTGVPPQVCQNCYQKYAGSVAQGAVLMAEHKAREEQKLLMWKSRVSLIKKARALMREKSFADSAIAYEKYLKILETVYECKTNEISPEHLKKTARTQELTVVASVYWDLMRIYDTSEKYTARMEIAAKKLAEFLPLTPLYPDVIKRAESFQKIAKKPGIVRNFLKSVTTKKSRCFIASSAFQSPLAPEVLLLQEWKEEALKPQLLGRVFISCYYALSPHIASFLDVTPFLKPFVRWSLRLLLRFLQKS